ncbi:DNA polymerase III subunit alpha [Streptosporangium sp. NPDC048047]|uniref:DNA polymerase III subunit alpha n=1 Tax=Streptosporangium sp. NPDC048047 TaxID=3155748 RepID=UPI00343CFEC2
MPEDFTHLHVASGFSLLYGASSPQALVDRARSLGMSSLAITDRDSLAGVNRFSAACRNARLRPLFGATIAIQRPPSPSFPGAPVEEGAPGERATFLARDAQGWAALCRLVSAAYAGGRARPLLDRQALAAHARRGSLTVLLGPDSDLGSALIERDGQTAAWRLRTWQDLFGAEAIRVEIVCHFAPPPHPGSLLLAGRMLSFAVQQKVSPVLTNAVRHAERSAARVCDVLAACRRRLPVAQARHVNAEAYLKSPAAMRRIAQEVTAVAGLSSSAAARLLAHTATTAEECVMDPLADLGIGTGRLRCPEAHLVGAVGSADAALRARCEAGLRTRGLEADQEALRRLESELSVIAQQGYATYFLTVADITGMIRAMGIRSSARGSAVGSLAVYTLGISQVDPLRHGLLMERFVSMRRRSLPDIDLDVESARRLQVYRAILTRYGAERVAAVAAPVTYRVRSAIRDVGAALGIDPGEIAALATAFPRIRARDARQAMSQWPQLAARGIHPGHLRLVWELVEALDGLPHHLAMHPCAVVISDATLLNRVPVQPVAAEDETGVMMTQFDKDDVEAFGLLKLDVLGVRMHSAIAHALKEIRRVDGRCVDLDDPRQVPPDDPETFTLIRSADTLGCFQIESPGQRDLLSRLQPEHADDLITCISLFRPGPAAADMIAPFLAARHGHAPPVRLHPDLAPILTETCGMVVFHEQLIRILATMTGCDYGRADEARRALADETATLAVHDWFTAAAANRGYDATTADRVWRIVAAFGAFGFAKAHAAAFAQMSLQSAWLKAHHPAAFYAGLLTHDPGMYPKRLLLADARRGGVRILGLDINHSGAGYRIEPLPGRGPADLSYGVRLALGEVKGMTSSDITRITAGRPYASLADCLRRTRLSLPVLERLVLAGAFDDLHGLCRRSGRHPVSGLNRRDLLLQAGDLHRKRSPEARGRYGSRRKAQAPASPPIDHAQQLPLELELDDTPRRHGLADLTGADQVTAELEILGLDASRHLITVYQPLLRELSVTAVDRLPTCPDRSWVLVAGAKAALRTLPPNQGRHVMFCSLDDGTGITDVVISGAAYTRYAVTVEDAPLLLVRGQIRRRGPRSVSVTATSCWGLTALDDSQRRSVRNTSPPPEDATSAPARR